MGAAADQPKKVKIRINLWEKNLNFIKNQINNNNRQLKSQNLSKKKKETLKTFFSISNLYFKYKKNYI